MTRTIDAAGVDWNGKTVASGPNPQTGPFYVEGAEPGDMLVVTIEKLETNRATGVFEQPARALHRRSRRRLPRASIAKRSRITWTIDKARGVARLDMPDVQPGGIELPLQADAGLRGRRAGAEGSDRDVDAGTRSAATWTTRRWARARS